MGLFAAQLVVDGLLIVFIVSAAIQLLGMGNSGVGYLNSAVGIGGLIGAVVTLALTGRRGLAGLFALGLVGWGIPIALIGVLPYPVAALLLLAFLGVANTLVDATAITLMQRSAPEEVMGRVFGVLESIIMGSIALGMHARARADQQLRHQDGDDRGGSAAAGCSPCWPSRHCGGSTPRRRRRPALLSFSKASRCSPPLDRSPLEELAARLERLRRPRARRSSARATRASAST